jgi:hypothetical protein
MARSASFVLLLLLALVSFSSAQSHVLPPPVGGITLDQVIRLSQSGLSDTVILAQIKKRPEPFALTPDEMLQLKSAQVSDQIIETMAGPAPLAIRASNSPSPRIAPKPSLPVEPGVYLTSAKGNSKIIGQVITFNRTGSLLVSHLTMGVKAAHDNVQISGAHASLAVDGQPVFYFIPAKQQIDDGVDAGDLVLVRMEEKTDRRQFEIAARGDWRASDGISITHQVPTVRTEEALGVYSLKPARTLRKGEYAIYLVRGDGLKAYIYDFSSNGE